MMIVGKGSLLVSIRYVVVGYGSASVFQVVKEVVVVYFSDQSDGVLHILELY